MTDKQIIIDCENICENYSKEVGCYNTFDSSCIKEQCFTYRLLQLLKSKEQECEELKKEQSEIKKYLGISHKTILEQLEELTNFRDRDREELDQLKAEYDKIKNCLAEIKGIAENMSNECFYDDFECKDCDMKNGCTYFNKKQILQKISEDLNDG